MDIRLAIDTVSIVENAGGQFYLAFPYISAIGNQTERLVVHVPTRQELPSEADKKALFEAVSVQGALGEWVKKDDGTVWLLPGQ